MSRMIGNEISPSRSASCGHGPTLIIWCTAGVSGIEMPAMSPILGLHTPHAITTYAASMSPPSVRTRRMRPSSTSRPTTSTVGTTVSAPDSSAFSRMIVPARSESTTPTLGVQKAPMNWSVSMKGTFSFTNSGLTSSASMPQAFALDMRRRSSSIRAGVRASSKPPDSVKTPISLYCRTESSVRSVISREWSTGKMKLEAWPVEPPGLGSAPLSSCTMSRQPSSARWCTRLLPTMPAPMTTTCAVAGTVAMVRSCQLLRYTQRSSSYETTSRITRPRPGGQPPAGMESASYGGGSAEPGVDLVLVVADPLRRGVLGLHAVLGDVLRHDVLVVVGPLEGLHQVHGRASLVDPRRGGDLLERRLRVVAGDLRRVVLAAVRVRRELHPLERDVGEEPLRLVEVADQELLVLLRLLEGRDAGGLTAGEDDLEVEAEVADDRLVELDVRRVRAEELALAAGLGRREVLGEVVQVLVVEDLRVLLGEPRRHVPADDADVAGRPQVHRTAVSGLGEELLLEVGVAPVLQDHVDLAGAEALPGDVLLEVLVLDRAAELGLHQRADHVGVCLVADPRVDRDADVAAVARLRGLRLVLLGLVGDRPAAVAAAGTEHERRARRDRSQASPLLPSDPRVPHSISLSRCVGDLPYRAVGASAWPPSSPVRRRA